MPTHMRKKIFVSSPSDVDAERRCVERVTRRLNTEFYPHIEFDVVRWESRFYTAEQSFQPQIERSIDCDIVVGILWSRIGTPLPAELGTDEQGQSWASGTAYELLSAIAQRRAGAGLPDVYVFRKTADISLPSDRPEREAEILQQRRRLNDFWNEHFHGADGEFKAAFQTFQYPEEFEVKLEKLLRQWIAEHNLIDDGNVWSTLLDGSPFRGLEPFDAAHSAVFFGRDREISRGVEALRQGLSRGQPSLFLLGPSGSGKSSIAHAGIVPRLQSPGLIQEVQVFRKAHFRPSDASNVMEALAAAFFSDEALPELREGPYALPAMLSALFENANGTSVPPITAALSAAGATYAMREGLSNGARIDLILVVDQLEEIFASSPQMQASFARLLHLLVGTGRIWLIMTIRADFYEQLLGVPEFAALKSVGASMDVAPPDHAALADIIRKPAETAGLTFETDIKSGIALDERLFSDSTPDILPLIQFTLQRLYEGRIKAPDGRFQLLNSVYERLGGIDGAVDTEAEAALKELSTQEISLLPKLVRRLAIIDSPFDGQAQKITGRPVPSSWVQKNPDAARLVERLVKGRILLAGHSSQGEAVFTLAHERILSAWKRVAFIVEESREFFRRQRDIESQYNRWDEGGRKKSLLIPTGRPLKQAKAILPFGDELMPEVRDYVHRSLRRQRNKRMKVAGGVALFGLYLGLSMVFGYVSITEQMKSEDTRPAIDSATARIVDLQRETASLTTRQMLADFRQAAGIRAYTADEIESFVDTIRFTQASSDDRTIGLIADRLLADAPTGSMVEANALRALQYAVSLLRVEKLVYPSETGGLILGGDEINMDETFSYSYRLAADRRQIVKMPVASAGESSTLQFDFDISRIQLSPNGERLFVIGLDGIVRIVATSDGKIDQTTDLSREGITSIYRVRWSPDSRYVAVTGASSMVTVIDTATKTSTGTGFLTHLRSLLADVERIEWTPQSDIVIVVDSLNSVWAVDTAGDARRLGCALDGSVSSLAVAPDGNSVALPSKYEVRICAVRSDREPVVHYVWDTAGFDSLQHAVWSPDGSRLAVASTDGRFAVIDAETGDLVFSPSQALYPVNGLAWSPSGDALLTAMSDGQIRLWSTSTGQALMSVNHDSPVAGLRWNSDSSKFVSISSVAVRLWNIGEGIREINADRISQARLASLVPSVRDTPKIVPDVGMDQCIIATAHPGDPLRPRGTGVEFESIRLAVALSTCETAVAREPSNGMFQYLYGRALSRAATQSLPTHGPDAAFAAFSKAAELGYPAAFNNLGLAYDRGEGIVRDPEKALESLERAMSLGVWSAARPLGWLYWNSSANEFDHKARAMAIWQNGAAHGDPSAMEQLAIVHELGMTADGVNKEEALYYYTLATQAYEITGQTFAAATSRLRRAILAQQLDPTVSTHVLERLGTKL